MTINPPPTACQPSSEVADLARITSVSSLMSNAMARAAGRPLRNRLLSPSVARADIAWPMRTDWGGHDPASPFAELMINTHSMFWPVAIFIFLSATINSVPNLWHNVIARASGQPRSVVTPICSMNHSYADIPWPMRTDLGGHDPATPFAELIINTHSMFWPAALFIVISAAYMVKK
ncbi:hypothetical protein FOL47_006976 [Perkinsus chesapeaki]|uniref:Uncharacterized protein n=1 Tax=Perkinsus chesapeaki TaxID=330153 RepID=A0A7J6N2G1_PERCH|nr:hypothetical protein FOL47_006976 [Perkinsus chesapeaki]